MLYVMNEVVLQNGRDSTETQYLNEFPKIMDQILSNLGESRSEALL